MPKRYRTAIISSAMLLAGCLPSFKTVPVVGEGPKVGQLVNHIKCELQHVVKGTEPNLSPNVHADNDKLIDRLQKNKFVAAVTLNLFVTDGENFNPSLSIIHPIAPGSMFNNTEGIGGQFDFTQDRTFTINFSVDLSTLGGDQLPSCPPLSTGIKGDLGLAEIVSDGLEGIDNVRDNDLYGSTGLTLPSATGITFSGTMTDPPPPPPTPSKPGEKKPKPMPAPKLADPLAPYRSFNFVGHVIPTPPPSDTPLPQVSSLQGVITTPDGNNPATVNLTGNIFQDERGHQLFTFTGPVALWPAAGLDDTWLS